MLRRISYNLTINFNGKVFNRVIIDQHYKKKHADTINDLLILKLVQMLDATVYKIENEIDGFQYFTIEPLIFSDKPYRLVVTICIADDFLGVVNAYRIDRRNYE